MTELLLILPFPLAVLIGVPFLIKERIIGVAILTRKKSSPQFTDKEFEKASQLAEFASVIINSIYSFQDVSELFRLLISTASIAVGNTEGAST